MRRPEVVVRPFEDGDLASVLAVRQAAFGDPLGEGEGAGSPEDVFRWKYLESPLGRAHMVVAEREDRVVGFRGWMPWPVVTGGRALNVARTADTATIPEYQGTGVFSSLEEEGLRALRAREIDFTFSTPTPVALGPNERLGVRLVTRLPVSVRVRRPLRFLSAVRSVGEPPHEGQTSVPVEAARRRTSSGTGRSSRACWRRPPWPRAGSPPPAAPTFCAGGTGPRSTTGRWRWRKRGGCPGSRSSASAGEGGWGRPRSSS